MKILLELNSSGETKKCQSSHHKMIMSSLLYACKHIYPVTTTSVRKKIFAESPDDAEQHQEKQEDGVLMCDCCN